MRLWILATALVFAFGAVAEARWRPDPAETFDWRFTGDLALEDVRGVVNLDAFDVSAGDIDDLRARGVVAVCYVNVGAWEDWRPDRRAFPRSVRGAEYHGWEGEEWLDVRQLDALLPIMAARMRLCRDKGFVAVEPDNIDGFQNKTGFPITEADQLRYNRAIAAEAHRLGLAIGLKNAPTLAERLSQTFDFAIAENCFKWKWCDMFRPFVAQGKAVVAIEYPEDGRNPLRHCREARRLGVQIVVKRRELDSWSRRCPE